MGAEVCPISSLTIILLATDGSDYSEHATTEAVNLAKACNTKFYATSVVEVNPEYEALAPQAVEKAEKEAIEFLEAVKECAEKEGVACETTVARGHDPAESIIEKAVEVKADMIVMGKHGRKKGLKKLLLGSCTSKVVGYAPCKVLVVP
ncbi:MAG: universal stress protein [Nitrospirota bacterium]|nr:MAG: universal stress protein [Nitrospirota bacterium]